MLRRTNRRVARPGLAILLLLVCLLLVLSHRNSPGSGHPSPASYAPATPTPSPAPPAATSTAGRVLAGAQSGISICQPSGDLPPPGSTHLTLFMPPTTAPGQPVAVAGLLTDAGGTALTGRSIWFRLGASQGRSVTDTDGVARARLAATGRVGTQVVAASFGGDARNAAVAAQRTLSFAGPGTRPGGIALPQPFLSLGLTTPPCVAPGMPDPIRLRVTNLGDMRTPPLVLRLHYPDGHSAQWAIDPLAPHTGRAMGLPWNVPAPGPRRPTESDSAYAEGLLALDNHLLTVQATLTWPASAGIAAGSLERSAQMLQTLPVLSLATHLEPAQLGPGESATVQATLQNLGLGNAANTTLTVTNPDGSPSVNTSSSLLSGLGTTLQTTWQMPSLTPRGTTEREAAYVARLSLLAQGVPFVAALQWQDTLGNRYGPIRDALRAPLPLPVLRAIVHGPGSAATGTFYDGNVEVLNTGSGMASLMPIMVETPGASITVSPSTTVIRPGERVRLPFRWRVAARLRGGPANLRVTVTWRDGMNDLLGPVTAQKTVRISAPTPPQPRG